MGFASSDEVVKYIGGIFEARNSSGSWVAVYEITSRPRAGWNTVDTGFSLTQAAGGQG